MSGNRTGDALMKTVEEWRYAENKADATIPKCPQCGIYLGIRRGVWWAGGKDTWLCDKCGEFEEA